MEINHSLFDKIFSKLGDSNPNDIIEKSGIAMKLYSILQGTTDTMVKIPNHDDMSQYLVPSILTACKINKKKQIILVEAGDRRNLRAINIISSVTQVLKDMDIPCQSDMAIGFADKAKYLCRRRYMDFMRSFLGQPNMLAVKLVNQGAPRNIDLCSYDGLTDKEKDIINVQECNSKCLYSHSCAYISHLKHLKACRYTFQFYDPYQFLSRIIDFYKKDRQLYFSQNAVVIISNPCSLIHAANSLLNRKITKNSMIQFISLLLTAVTGNKAHHKQVRSVCKHIEKHIHSLFNHKQSQMAKIQKTIFKIFSDFVQIKKICSEEFNSNYTLRKSFEYMYGALGEYVNDCGRFELKVQSQVFELAYKEQNAHKAVLLALKAVPAQIVFLVNN